MRLWVEEEDAITGKSYELMVLNAHEGCKDGVEWVEQEDAITD